jgi:hypothetical protein
LRLSSLRTSCERAGYGPRTDFAQTAAETPTVNGRSERSREPNRPASRAGAASPERGIVGSKPVTVCLVGWQLFEKQGVEMLKGVKGLK